MYFQSRDLKTCMGSSDSYNTIYENSVYILVSNNSDIKKFVAYKIIDVIC